MLLSQRREQENENSSREKPIFLHNFSRWKYESAFKVGRKLHSLLKQVTTDRFHTSKNKSKKQITKNITFFLHTQRACLAWAYGESFIRGWAAPVHSILCVLGAEGGHRRKTAQPHLAWRHYQVACINHTSSPHIPAHILLSVKI